MTTNTTANKRVIDIDHGSVGAVITAVSRDLEALPLSIRKMHCNREIINIMTLLRPY